LRDQVAAAAPGASLIIAPYIFGIGR